MTERLTGLDGLRGIAALAVPGYHLHVPAMMLVKHLGGHWTLSLAAALTVAALLPSVRRAIGAASLAGSDGLTGPGYPADVAISRA